MSAKFASNPACEGKKFYVEVTGIQHGSEQDFEFYDLTDMSQQSALENKKLIDPELDDTTVYSWDWCDESENRNVWLKIEAEDGPIKLPLFQGVTAISRKQDEQDYLVHSVLPLTLLPTYQDEVSYEDRLAPIRAGFIYIFYNNKAWREVNVHPEDDGNMSLRDIHLYRYRTGKDKPFKDEERVATGLPLKELWIPAKDNNQGARVHIAFSESQWSSQYLNYLEENVNELTQRAIAFHKLNIEGDIDVLRTKDLPEMRVREPDLEFFLAEPSKLNRDLSGNWVKKTYQEIKDEITSANADGSRALDILKYNKPFQYEYGVKQSVLKEILTPDLNTENTWSTSQSNDFLEDAKQRQLRAIVLDDPLFDLRHHTFLTLFAMGYLQQVYVDMSTQKYYQCAELVQKMVMPKSFGEQGNPFYEHKDDIDQYLGGRFHRTLRTLERQICCRDTKLLQEKLNNKLQDTRIARVLRDISSLNDLNAAAAHVIIGNAIGALSASVEQLDQMSNNTDIKQSQHLETVRQIISSNSNHPLHAILFPPEGTITLDESYTSPTPNNPGSGFATPESLAIWAQEDFLINDEKLQFMDLAFMSKANDNEEGAFNTERRLANVTDGILKGYFDALQALSKDLTEHAKVIAFNSAYAPVLGLMKATNSKFFGDILYTPVGGAEYKGTVVGVHGHGLSYGLSTTDRDYIKTRNKKTPMGRLYDKSGKLFASTGRNAFKSSDLITGVRADTGPKLPLKVVVVSENNAITNALNQANTRRTLEDLNKSGLTASNAYEKFRVPYFIVVIEMINLKNNYIHVERMFSKERSAYAFLSSISAVTDLGVALVHASNLYTKNASWLATNSQKMILSVPDKVVELLTFRQGTVRLISNLSSLGVVSIGAGLLTAGIAAWDTFKLAKNNDIDASIAMGMVATGTLVTTIATGLFTTSAPVLFGMGPIAWLGIGVAVTGLALYTFFKDSPMEIWLKNGPFGADPSSNYNHLQDPKVAFNRFISLLFNLSIKSYRIEAETSFSKEITNRFKAQGVTHVVYLNTNLASLLNINAIDIHFHARQAIQRVTETISRTSVYGPDIETNVINQSKHDLAVIHQEDVEGGCAYFIQHNLTIPESYSEYSVWKNRSYTYKFLPVLVIRARLQVEELYLPALPLEKQDEPSVPTANPDFTEEDKRWIKMVIPASS
ncbi:hypothetical protein OPW41_20690 [Vibrio europaeus]|uniref:Uncharacterized protein n=1 Tax=Vibrio europaeus TaxID=300876 RepID=A0A178JEL5_9VIBR|nr:hypothetical protein [Vibrio europaeus]MDC5707238.1 hypothetical protein [Vibrio europaeus]MDC5712603.1 hypothetical protein [Vibrio europaeus]MDC5717246.1 hypothetical protein [Vibrio europaeus]MDC5721220.1 hypothetical protein [Vibrio europaeus]MDC5726546.1 hypothetical protein [Vibrio europaeus]